MKILRKSPFFFEFAMRAFYSDREEVSPALDASFKGLLSIQMPLFFSSVDFSKFRPDVVPGDLVNMLVWMVDGYLHEKRRAGGAILDDLLPQYHRWTAMLRRVAYKEEYL